MKRFKWTVVFEVDETWVADGFDLTDARALSMLSRTLSYAQGCELGARVTKAPADSAIFKVQGYKPEEFAALTAKKEEKKRRGY